MSKRFKLDKNDGSAIVRGAIIAISGAIGTYILAKSNEWFGQTDDATKLLVAAVVGIVMNAIRKYFSSK